MEMKDQSPNSNEVEKHYDKEFIKKFDFVMVFPMIKISGNEYAQSDEAKMCSKAILEAGLDLYTYYSVQNDELIFLIFCPLQKLKQFAESSSQHVLFDPKKIQEKLEGGISDWRIKPTFIEHNEKITKLHPHYHIFGKFQSALEDLYFKYDEGKVIFPNFIRLKVIYHILVANVIGGANIQIPSLLCDRKLYAFYPLHSEEGVELLNSQWRLTNMPWNQPIDAIRYYNGEKVALYNQFLGHYSAFLIIPSFIGITFQFVVWSTLDFSSPVLPFFSVVITIGSIGMLESWKRIESFTVLKWGMSEFEKQEIDRPQFYGEEMTSFIDGSKIRYTDSRHSLRLQFSFTLIGTCALLVIGIVAGIYYLRFSLQTQIGSNSSTVASAINTVQIVVSNLLFQSLSVTLTDLENHRTDTSYQDSMIAKLFVFQFVNSYASFFFLAFIAQNLPRPNGTDPSYIGECGYSNCMYPLSINLAIIFGTRFFLNNFLVLLQPFLQTKWNRFYETKGAKNQILTIPEQNYLLLKYDPILENISSYADTAIEFGYMILFITALPIGCFFSLVNSYAKIRVDAYRLTHYYQRPIPAGVQDIGTWQGIFNILAVASVVTNAGLICFTMTVLDTRSITSSGKLWIFIGFQWVLVSIQLILSISIPSSHEVEIQLKRTRFICDKLILRIPDTDFDAGSLDDPELPREESRNSGCCCFVSKRIEKRRKNQNLAPVQTKVYMKADSWRMDGSAPTPKGFSSDTGRSSAGLSSEPIVNPLTLRG